MTSIGFSYGSLAPVAGLVPGQLRKGILRLQQEADFLQGLPLKGSNKLPIPQNLLFCENIFCGINGVDGKWVYGDGPIMGVEKLCFEDPQGCAEFIKRAQRLGVQIIENEMVFEPVKPDLLELTPHHGVLPSKYLEQATTGQVKGFVADTFHMEEKPDLKYVDQDYINRLILEGGFLNDHFLSQAGSFIRLIHVQFDRSNASEMLDWERWTPESKDHPQFAKIERLLSYSREITGILLEPSFHHWRQIAIRTAFSPTRIIDHLCRQRDALAWWLNRSFN